MGLLDAHRWLFLLEQFGVQKKQQKVTFLPPQNRITGDMTAHSNSSRKNKQLAWFGIIQCMYRNNTRNKIYVLVLVSSYRYVHTVLSMIVSLTACVVC